MGIVQVFVEVVLVERVGDFLHNAIVRQEAVNPGPIELPVMLYDAFLAQHRSGTGQCVVRPDARATRKGYPYE